MASWILTSLSVRLPTCRRKVDMVARVGVAMVARMGVAMVARVGVAELTRFLNSV